MAVYDISCRNCFVIMYYIGIIMELLFLIHSAVDLDRLNRRSTRATQKPRGGASVAEDLYHLFNLI